MRVGRQRGVLCEGQVVAVVRGPVSQVPRTERGLRGVRNVLVAFGELEDDRLGGDARQRVFPQVRRIGHRVAGLQDPLGVVEDLLDRHGPGHRVGYRGLNDSRLVPSVRATVSGTPSRSGMFSLK